MRLHCCMERLRFLPQFGAGEGGAGPGKLRWAPSLVAAAGPQRYLVPRGGSDLAKGPLPPWASAQKPASLPSLKPRYGNPRLALDGSCAPPTLGPLSLIPCCFEACDGGPSGN